MKLVVIIPAYNEEKTISRVIREIPRKEEWKTEVIVINDGSTDKTSQVAKKSGADEIIEFKFNKGLGVAFKTGIEAALKRGADIIVNIDADGQFDPRDIPKLIQPILDKEADVVICSRFLDKKLEPKMPRIKRFGNSIFTRLVNFVTGQSFTDTQCGFRAYGREATLRINILSQYTYTQETLIDLVDKGMKIAEVPCKVEGQRRGESRLVNNVFGYGIRALMIILRTIRDQQPMKFFGGLGVIVFLVGFIIALILFIRWLFIGKTSPFTSLIPFSMTLLILGFLLLVLALVVDMMGRQRKVQEEILYYQKRQLYEGTKRKATS